MPRRVAVLLLVIALAAAGAAPAQDLLRFYSAATEAMREDRPAEALRHYREGLETIPGSPHLWLGAAHAAAATGDTVACLDALEHLAALGASYELDRIEALAPLLDAPAFAPVVARIAANGAEPEPAAIAATLAGADLWTEGIAWDPATGDLLAGSVKHGKLVRVRDAEQTDLGTSADDGLMEVLGLDVDPARRQLWAVTGRDEGTPGGQHDFGETPRDNEVVVYDLDTGALLARHVLPRDDRIHLLNDVAVARDGTAYVTDMTTSEIYRVRPGGGLELFHAFAEPVRPNGLVVDDANGRLHVACLATVMVVDLATGAARPLAHPEDLCLGLGDGMALAGRELFIVQNNAMLGMRVLRCRLDAAGDAVVAAEALRFGLPEGLMPYTCALGEGVLYVNGTAPFARYDDPEPPPAPVIVAVPLPLR